MNRVHNRIFEGHKSSNIDDAAEILMIANDAKCYKTVVMYYSSKNFSKVVMSTRERLQKTQHYFAATTFYADLVIHLPESTNTRNLFRTAPLIRAIANLTASLSATKIEAWQ